jgi:hypothetical protein
VDALNLEFPELLLHDTRILGGLESLFTPRLRRAAGEIEPLEDVDSQQADRVLAQLERNLRDSLTVNRANRFVKALPGESGAQWSSEQILKEHVHNDEDVADLIACLLHAHAADSQFEIEVPRSTADVDTGVFDPKRQYRIERFTVVKK